MQHLAVAYEFGAEALRVLRDIQHHTHALAAEPKP